FGHSGSIGSFTFRIISAFAHTASAEGTICAPTARYASSLNPEPSPAPCSTSTVWLSLASDSAPAGTSATRFSAVLISFGTPTITLCRHWVREKRPSAVRERKALAQSPTLHLPSALRPSSALHRGCDTARCRPPCSPNDTSGRWGSPATASAVPTSAAWHRSAHRRAIPRAPYAQTRRGSPPRPARPAPV